MNIIGDIAGNYDTLMALLKKMPDDEVLSVGDMIDRGPRSHEVLKWFKTNGKALMGNHEHLMLNAVDDGNYYAPGIWQHNGGVATLQSFGVNTPIELAGHPLIDWVRGLPLYHEMDGALITHSFVHYDYDSVQEACELGTGFAWRSDLVSDNSLLWNRRYPKRMTNDKGSHILQIAGHNSQFGLRWFDDHNGKYALCIDSSWDKVLTGVHWPTLQIFQQEYID